MSTWKVNTWKDAKDHRKYKLKSQNTSALSVKIAVIKRLIIPSADKEEEKLKLSFTTGRNVKWDSLSRKQFFNFLKS